MVDARRRLYKQLEQSLEPDRLFAPVQPAVRRSQTDALCMSKSGSGACDKVMAPGKATIPVDTPLSERGDTSESRVQTLNQGVTAIVKAMAGHAQFANDNEEAFRLFRKGCQHCKSLVGELDSIDPKTTIVEFLDRISARRAVARQVQELAAILVRADAWRAQLAEAPPQLRELLEAAELLEPAPVVLDPIEAIGGLRHDARIFLREQRSQRWLSVAFKPSSEAPDANDGNVAACIMTELATSLFICHHSQDMAITPDMESQFGTEFDIAEPAAMVVCDIEKGIWGFEHEGEPEFGHFLACRRPWRLRIKRSKEYELCCNSTGFSRLEKFKVHPDATIQHVASGLWFYVNPDCPDTVTMHPSQKSLWEALPAI